MKADKHGKHKNISPQRHGGHREKHCIINCATGAVNKVKLRVLCASVVKIMFPARGTYNDVR